MGKFQVVGTHYVRVMDGELLYLHMFVDPLCGCIASSVESTYVGGSLAVPKQQLRRQRWRWHVLFSSGGEASIAAGQYSTGRSYMRSLWSFSVHGPASCSAICWITWLLYSGCRVIIVSCDSFKTFFSAPILTLRRGDWAKIKGASQSS